MVGLEAWLISSRGPENEESLVKRIEVRTSPIILETILYLFLQDCVDLKVKLVLQIRI